MVGRGFGGLTGPPTDFGSDLQRAQAFLTKYKPGQGPAGSTARSASAGKHARGRRAPASSKGQTTPSTISSLSGSSDNDDVSIEFEDEGEAHERSSHISTSSKQPAGRRTPVAGQQTKATTRQLGSGAAAGNSRSTAPASSKSNGSSDISISFSEDEVSSGSIEVGVSRPKKNKASAKIPPKTAPKKAMKPGDTKKTKGNGKEKRGVAKQLSMSSDLSLSGSIIELDDDVPPPAVLGKSTPSNSHTAKTSKPASSSHAKSAANKPKRLPSKQQQVEVELLSSGEIVFSSSSSVVSGDISSLSDMSDMGSKPASAAKGGSRPKPRSGPGTRTAKKADISIEFSEDDEDGDISFEDLGPVTTKRTSSQGWQPPGTAAKRGTSSKPATLSKKPSEKRVAVDISEDFSITMTESEISKDLEDAAAATESLYAQLTPISGAAVGGGSSSSSSISISHSSSASVEEDPVSSLLASDLGEAAAATEALYSSLQPATMMRQGSSSSSEPESLHNAKLASDLNEAAAATDALFDSLQAAPLAAGSGSSEEPYSPADLEDAMDATEDLYRTLGHMRDHGSDDGSKSEDGDRTLTYSPALDPDVSASLQDAADATDALYQMLVPVGGTGRSSSQKSSSSGSAVSADLQDAAAATDALFSQLISVGGARDSSDDDGGKSGNSQADDVSYSSGSAGGFGALAPTWTVKGESGDLGGASTLSSNADAEQAAAHRASVSLDEHIVKLQHPSVLPQFPGMQLRARAEPEEPKMPPNTRSVATQMGTLNEMGCQVGFDERFRLLFEGCTLPKDMPQKLHPPSVVQYLPAPVPGGWVPWGAPIPPAGGQQPSFTGGAGGSPSFTPANTNNGHAHPPPQASTGGQPPSPDASTVDEYSMSFEEETTVESNSGMKVVRTVRSYNSRSASASFVSESLPGQSLSRVMESHTMSRTLERIDSEVEESIASSSRSFSDDFSEEMSSGTRSKSPPRRKQPPPTMQSQQPQRSPNRSAVPQPTASLQPPPSIKEQRPQQAMEQQPLQPQQTPMQQQPGYYPIQQPYYAPQLHPPYFLASTVPANGHSAVPFTAALASVMRPSFVPGGMEEMVSNAHSEELFRHQVGTLKQKLARARVGHVESVEKLMSSAVGPAAPAGGFHSYTTLQDTLVYIRNNYPYQPTA